MLQRYYLPPYHLVSHERALSLTRCLIFVLSEMICWGSDLHIHITQQFFMLHRIHFSLSFFSCIYKYAVYAVPTYIIYIICWIAMRSTIKYQDTNNWCWWRYFNAVRRKMSIALMVYSYCNYLRWCYIFTDNSELLCGSSSFLLPHLWHLLIHQLFFYFSSFLDFGEIIIYIILGNLSFFVGYVRGYSIGVGWFAGWLMIQ